MTLCACLGLLSGCATLELPSSNQLHSQLDIEPYHSIEHVPLIPQQDKFCGPASFATIAQYNGLDISQPQAAEMVYTPGRSGTFQHDIVSAFARSGLQATPVNSFEEILAELSDDHPVLIFQNLGLSFYPVWHYSVLTGYDLPERKFKIHDGSEEAKWKSFQTVANTWARAGQWAYIAVQPDIIPRTATLDEVLQSAAALETAGHPNKAKTLYETAQKHYPDAPKIVFGLANIAMGQKNYNQAEKLYKQALKSDPEFDLAANNLAYSLKAQKKRSEACAVLNKALKNSASPAQKTLLDSRAELCGGR